MASVEYGKIRAYLEKKDQVTGNMGMQIVGHVLALDIVLITSSIKEFERVGGLVLDNWTL